MPEYYIDLNAAQLTPSGEIVGTLGSALEAALTEYYEAARNSVGRKTLKFVLKSGVASSVVTRVFELYYNGDGQVELYDVENAVSRGLFDAAATAAINGAIYAATLGAGLTSGVAIAAAIGTSVLYSRFLQDDVDDLLDTLLGAIEIQLISATGQPLGGVVYGSAPPSERQAIQALIAQGGQPATTRDGTLAAFPMVAPGMTMQVILSGSNTVRSRYEVYDGTLVETLASELNLFLNSFLAFGGYDPARETITNGDYYSTTPAGSWLAMQIGEGLFRGDRLFVPTPTIQRSAQGAMAEIALDAVVATDILAIDANGSLRASINHTPGDILFRKTLMVGNTTADLLRGYSDQDYLLGADGDDILVGNGGDDRLLGGRHNDLLYGQDQADILVGGMGSDQLFGGPGDDLLYGGTLIYDYTNWQTRHEEDGVADGLYGEDGNDVIYAGASDIIVGGNGDDMAVFAEGSTSYTLERLGSEVRVTHRATGRLTRLQTVERLKFQDAVIDLGQTPTRLSPAYLGQVGEVGLFRLDLATAGVASIQTITLYDDGLISGGSGAASGFDLDMIKLSTTQVTRASAVSALPGLEGFDFSHQNVLFEPGFLQPWRSSDPQVWNRNQLFGTVGETQVNFATATLDLVDGYDRSNTNPVDFSSVSIGEGGRITFRLTRPIATEGLYLYLSDVGGGNDAVRVSVSPLAELVPREGIALQGTSSDDFIDLPLNGMLGVGNDELRGNLGNDTLFAGAGHDRVFGNGGHDVLSGGLGDDYLSGGPGNDRYLYNPGDGNDILDESGSVSDRDVLQFGGGITANQLTYTVDGANLLIRFLSMAGQITLLNQLAGALHGSTLEELQFEGGAVLSLQKIIANLNKPPGKTLQGNRRSNRLQGGLGDDVLSGLGGNDTLLGSVGDDTLRAGAGQDVARGQGGNDWLYGGNGGDRLYGNVGTDRLLGQGGADQLLGGSGPDQLYGGGGDDVLKGQGGDDRLVGGAGRDRLLGGAGNDGLIGDRANDSLTGGSGADTFFIQRKTGNDVITDFRNNQDKIVLAGVRLRSLQISNVSQGTLIRWEGSHSLLVRGISSSLLLNDVFLTTP